jgi:hypothetical protein
MSILMTLSMSMRVTAVTITEPSAESAPGKPGA